MTTFTTVLPLNYFMDWTLLAGPLLELGGLGLAGAGLAVVLQGAHQSEPAPGRHARELDLYDPASNRQAPCPAGQCLVIWYLVFVGKS